MKKILTFIRLTFVIGMTSCSLSDDEIIDVNQEQIEYSTSEPTNPPLEDEGDEEELDPNG